MEVVRQEGSENVIWLKCPGCQGFLPRTEEDEAGETRRSEAGDENELALEDLDIDNAREYSEHEEYSIGDVIHHRSWNDYGKVIAKDVLPGNRRTIWAQFIRQGRVQLLEGIE